MAYGYRTQDRTSDPIDTSAPLPKCPDNSAPRQFGPNAETVRTIGPNTSVLGPDISALRETQQGQHGFDHAVYYTQTVSTEDSTLPGRSLIFTIALSCIIIIIIIKGIYIAQVRKGHKCARATNASSKRACLIDHLRSFPECYVCMSCRPSIGGSK